MLDRGGVKEQKEQNKTSRDLEETICVELAKGERQYNDRECMDYEREYLPLHLFMNSRVGYQTPILKDRGCGVGAGDHKSEEKDNTEITVDKFERRGRSVDNQHRKEERKATHSHFGSECSRGLR